MCGAADADAGPRGGVPVGAIDRRNMKVASALLVMAAIAVGESEAAAPSPAPPVPAGHPRVYLRPSDLAALRTKSKDRGARRLWQSVGRHSSDPVVLAFTGLLEQDTSKCAKAVEAMGATIQKTVSYHGKPSSKETTVAGRTFLSVQHEGAVVLDWCYDTMDNKTKMSYVDGLKKVANMDAPGFPIVSAVHCPYTPGESSAISDTQFR